MDTIHINVLFLILLAAVFGFAAWRMTFTRRIVGSAPLVENVATLLEPPGSDRDEGTFTAEVLQAGGVDLLLDLHNLHANALNFGFDPVDFLDHIPAEHIAGVHLSGGRFIPEPVKPGGTPGERLLDDHLHDVPGRVYTLLTEVGRRAPRALTVTLERDGLYPPMEVLMEQLDRARSALAAGRAMHRNAPIPSAGIDTRGLGPSTTAAATLERFLAAIYIDAERRRRFLADPVGEATRAGVEAGLCVALSRIDRTGLQMAAGSFARKRTLKQECGRRPARGPWSQR